MQWLEYYLNFRGINQRVPVKMLDVERERRLKIAITANLLFISCSVQLLPLFNRPLLQ